ncbi:hypothetical protein SLEP1_g57982 [Rubroshorea leprosula]|uniref:Uncharacterized protein n=1 Tax=Rubroshorea leprosula TaxID=152421 RepID=A0AAV5MSD6_9ROSI|nr:hypothetical protein SLEP1_g57982 [Rubroshorea leprosula]
MVDEANLEKVALENRVESMENTLKELMASFQSFQATLVTRALLTTNPLFEGNVSVANLPITISTLGKEPMSSCPPNPTIGGTFGTKPFVLNAGVTTVQSNDQEGTQVVKSITEDEDKAIKAKDGIKSRIIMDYQAMKSLLEQYQNDSSGVSSSKKENENSTISSVYEAHNQSRGQFNNRFQAPTYQSTSFTSQSRPIYASGTSRPQQEKKRHYFDKLPMSYTEVFRQLIAARLVTPVPMVPLNPPFPIWYNPQARCEYHSGGVGHDLENCLALKHRVQDLIDAKELQITSEPEVVGPNVIKNPLPTHDGPTVNMIEKDSNKGHEVITSTYNDGLSASFEKLSICVIDEAKGDDKLILPTHGEALDNKIVEILPVPIIKS